MSVPWCHLKKSEDIRINPLETIIACFSFIKNSLAMDPVDINISLWTMVVLPKTRLQAELNITGICG